MNYIKDPEGTELTVEHKHLNKKEAEELAAFIKEKKEEQLEIKITATDRQELELLVGLFQKMNLKWTLV